MEYAKRAFSRTLGKGQGELVRFRRSSGGWKIELALLTEHYAGIRGSARQKRGEKARERKREIARTREREEEQRQNAFLLV